MGRGNRKKNKKDGNVAIINNNSDTEEVDVEQKFSYTKSEKTVSKKSQQNVKENSIQNRNIENTNSDNLHKPITHFDKMIYVDNFVNSFWDRICVSEEIEDIIIEDERDNEIDDFYDEY